MPWAKRSEGEFWKGPAGIALPCINMVSVQRPVSRLLIESLNAEVERAFETAYSSVFLSMLCRDLSLRRGLRACLGVQRRERRNMFLPAFNQNHSVSSLS